MQIDAQHRRHTHPHRVLTAVAAAAAGREQVAGGSTDRRADGHH